MIKLLKKYCRRCRPLVLLANRFKLRGVCDRLVVLTDKHIQQFIAFLNRQYPEVNISLLDCGARGGCQNLLYMPPYSL